MTPFLERFGTFDEEEGKWYLPSALQSLMNSLPLLGKFLGTVICSPLIERIGHRYSMAATCLVQVVGPISE